MTNMFIICVVAIYLLGLPIAVYLAGRFKVDDVVGTVGIWPLVAAFWIVVGILYFPGLLMLYIYNLGKAPKKGKAKNKPQEVK